MPDTSHVLVVMPVGAGVTLGLRTVPFAVLARLRRWSVLQHLSMAMPAGILTILAVTSCTTWTPPKPAAAARRSWAFSSPWVSGGGAAALR